MSLFIKFNVILLAVFGVSLIPVALLADQLLQANAQTQVISNARIMMQSALATRVYTSQQIQPLLAPRQEDEFFPQSVPSYSATEIFNTLRQTSPEFTYKEATLNPTNLRDRTVDWEADVVNAFRADPSLTEIVGERDNARGRSLHLARPIRINEAACLSCHSTPEAAPRSFLKIYGPGNGFGWKLGETVGAQIVTVPMAVPVAMARKAFNEIVWAIVAVFGLMLVFLNVLLWLVVIRPIKRVSVMAYRISNGELEVPEVTVRGSDEVAVLFGAFNRMRISLEKALKLLEDA